MDHPLHGRVLLGGDEIKAESDVISSERKDIPGPDPRRLRSPLHFESASGGDVPWLPAPLRNRPATAYRNGARTRGRRRQVPGTGGGFFLRQPTGLGRLQRVSGRRADRGWLHRTPRPATGTERADPGVIIAKENHSTVSGSPVPRGAGCDLEDLCGQVRGYRRATG